MTDPTTALAAALHDRILLLDKAIRDVSDPPIENWMTVARTILAALSGYTLVKDEELERLRRIEAAARALVGQTTFSDDKAHVYPDVDPDGFANNPRTWHRLRAALADRSEATPQSLDAAWKAAEAALPEGWGVQIIPGQPEAWEATLIRDTPNRRYPRQGNGHTPAEALRNLAAALTTRSAEAESSVTKESR